MLDPAFAVRLVRQAEHLTQRQLAKRAKIGLSTIRRIEERVVCPNLATFRACCDGLGVPAWIVVELATAKSVQNAANRFSYQSFDFRLDSA